MKKNQLSVRLHGEPVGILEQTPTGKMSFTYNSDAKIVISIGMPLREEPYGEVQCEAFFGGLLPESDIARKAIGRQYGISYNNSFALLKAIGYDCAGAISCHTIDEQVIPQRSFPLIGTIVTENELYQHIKELPRKPLFMDVDGLRLSLAGVHDKAAVCIIDNQIAFPKDGCPTTHILKPASRDYEGLVENEYFCLEIASQMGLSIPRSEIRWVKDIPYLLIERYDRRIQNNHVERIHQEDFCQALSFPSVQKYQKDGGPGFKNCFDLLNETTQPAISRNMLASALVFNFLICNMDAHSKNFSLLQTKNTQFQLAPFYDLVCTLAYPNLVSKMAMKIGKKYEVDFIFPRHWEQLSKEINYAFPALKQLIKKQGESFLNSIDHNREFFIGMTRNSPIIDKIIDVVKGQINKTLKRFEV